VALQPETLDVAELLRIAPRRVGWFALLITGSAAAMVALRATSALDIYCDWSSSCVFMLMTALPSYVAMLGMTLPVLLMARSLRDSPASRYLRASALSCAILAFAAYLAMALGAYDEMWANYGSPVGLDAPRFTRFLPSIVLSMASYLWPVFLGAAIVLTSLVLDGLRLSRVVLALGVAAGLTLIASLVAPYHLTALYFGYGLIALWAAALASQTLVATRRAHSTA
jgi:hypothetical protein